MFRTPHVTGLAKENYFLVQFSALLCPILVNLSVLFMIPTITRNVVAVKQTGIGELMKFAGVNGIFIFLLFSVLDDSDQPFGAQWDYEGLNYFFPVKFLEIIDLSDVSLFQIIMMLVGDILIYLLLARYFENVLPSEHRVRLPFYLFNFVEYFRSKSRKGRIVQVSPAVAKQFNPPEAKQSEGMASAGANNQNPTQKESITTGQTDGGTDTDTCAANGKESSTTANMNKPDPGVNSSFEPEVARNATVGIEIQNIFKNFGRKQAVNGVSLRMYTGDIFALLGHNGAGKRLH